MAPKKKPWPGRGDGNKRGAGGGAISIAGASTVATNTVAHTPGSGRKRRSVAANHAEEGKRIKLGPDVVVASDVRCVHAEQHSRCEQGKCSFTQECAKRAKKLANSQKYKHIEQPPNCVSPYLHMLDLSPHKKSTT